jgi:uncharacterized protein (TIGR02246 family)
MMKRLAGVVCVAACLAFAASAGAQSADPAMEKLRQSYEQAWLKGDANAVAAHYAEDALVVNADGVHHGRAEVVKNMTTNFAGSWKGSTLSVHLGKTQPLGPDTTVNEGTYEVKGLTGPDGKPMAIKGSYMNTLVKKGGAWVIVGHMAFAPLPPGMTPAAK